MKREYFLKLALVLASMACSLGALAECEVVDGDRKTPFDGKSLSRLLVEKKSLTVLNREFPHLNVIEKTFKGELHTCTNCTEKHIVCKQ